MMANSSAPRFLPASVSPRRLTGFLRPTYAPEPCGESCAIVSRPEFRSAPCDPRPAVSPAIDWRRCEAMLNDWGQYKTAIDGLDIHFLHVRSKHENALPLIITHGWPGSVIEFMKIIGPLTDPTAHGGKAEDAFHVIAPSLPGHGFSDKATE